MPLPGGAPLLSGFCEMNQHEGTRPKSYNGIPMKVCLLSWCECECHKQLDKMFEMVGLDRTPQDNPEYVPFQRTFWMPSDEPGYLLPVPTPEITDEGVAVEEREVTVSPTGRTQRGGLEFWVQRECLAWIVDQDPTYCTIKFLSEEIGRVEGIPNPSQGAIAAVFDRWMKYGYAKIANDRPRRFLGLTEEGQEKGLDWCRANYKKTKK